MTSESSFFTVSPGFTSTSITGTSLKSPMSGTFTSMAANSFSSLFVLRARAQTVQGAGLSASMPYFLIASRDLGGRHLAVLGQRLQRGERDVVAIDLEEARAAFSRESLRPKPSVPSTL